MGTPAVDIGDKLHIITRRLFESEIRRHFVGEVIGISGEIYSVQGHTFVFTQEANVYIKRPELRTRLFALGHEGFIVNKISRGVRIAALAYQVINKHLFVTDNDNFSLDITEFGSSR